MRALAAIDVVLLHEWTTAYGAQQPPPGLTAHLTDWMGYGHLGVAVFIVISGYSLGISEVRDRRLFRGARKFFWRRAWRILPPYYAALALSLVLIATIIGGTIGPLWNAALPVTATGVITHLLLIHDFRDPNQIDYPLWTIAVEGQLYLTLPLLLLLRRRVNWPLLVLSAIAVSAVLLVLILRVNLPALSPQLFALFVFGLCAAELSSRPDRPAVPWLWLALGFAVLTFLGLRYIATPLHLVRQDWFDYTAGAATALLLVGLSDRPRHLLRRALEFRPLPAIGLFSYSLYLVHAPLLAVAWRYGVSRLSLHPSERLAVLVIVVLPLIIGCAWIFSKLTEKPATRLRRRIDGSRRPEASSAGSAARTGASDSGA
jgi:peptidoglycan/LPS O-acetylase OafA/YrhL